MDLDKRSWRFVSVDAGNMISALITDQIDGFLHSEPTTTLAIVNNAGHLFMQAARGDMGSNPPPNSFLTTRRKSPGTIAGGRAAVPCAFRGQQWPTKPRRIRMIPIMSDWAAWRSASFGPRSSA